MWTPRRVSLLFAGFIVLFSAYGAYAHFLGGIDGLPPLPQEYWPNSPASLLPLLPPAPGSFADAKLRQAYGEASDVLKRTIKVELQARDLVLAADQFKIVPDDDRRVMLQPFHIALFGKTSGEGGTPEINTVSSDVAYLTLDSPIKNVMEIGNCKIVACELIGQVKIINNRRTARRDDDLSLLTQGPVFYQEKDHHIWTDREVRLEDWQSKPKPTQISAVGMDVYLTAEEAAAPAAAHGRKAKTENISGVKQVKLRQDVVMHLFVDAHSGFLAAGKTDQSETAPGPARTGTPGSRGDGVAASPASQPELSHVMITTDGPFVYDVQNDRARFDVSRRPSSNRVNVTRENEPGKFDQLDCDHLELQFSRKSNAPGNGAAPSSERAGLEIETAHATASPGKPVVLTSDAEMFDAHAAELFYDARTQTSTLKGEPKGPAAKQGDDDYGTYAVKEGNAIYARELQLVNRKGAEQLTALGPGKVELLDKNTGERPLQAFWQDKLVSGKEGGLDCLTLTGKASFEDREHNQRLRGDFLKVWLQPAGAPPPGSPGQQRLRPHHVEAKGHVSADSAEMRVKEPTDHLIIWFKDRVAAAGEAGPGQEAPPRKSVLTGAGYGTGKAAARDTALPPPSLSPKLGEAKGRGSPAAADRPKKPIDLSARSVQASVIRTDNKNDLDSLWCEGAVIVHQDGATPDDDGIDIRGETLDLTHSPEGHILDVRGKLAQVQLNKITILGPKVNIDQKNNVARVDGVGLMKMPARNDFNGGKLARPAELTIRWKDDMFFNGKNALFHGDIQANQGTGGLLCQEMQVSLDRPVSFKEGEKSGQPAKVERLVCDKKVYLQDNTFAGQRLVGCQRLAAPEVDVDYELGLLRAPGRGILHIVQKGAPGEPFASGATPKSGPRTAPPAATKPAKEEFTLTQATYSQALSADNNKRIATLFGDVEVIQAPIDPRAVSEKTNFYLDKHHPPPGYIFLHCERLDIYTSAVDGKRSKEMTALTNVLVSAQEFWGTAATVQYNEEFDRVTFKGEEGNLAKLYRAKTPGAPYDVITGKKITYWRRTNTYAVMDGREVKVAQ